MTEIGRSFQISDLSDEQRDRSLGAIIDLGGLVSEMVFCLYLNTVEC